jgi:hypothetical protein
VLEEAYEEEYMCPREKRFGRRKKEELCGPGPGHIVDAGGQRWNGNQDLETNSNRQNGFDASNSVSFAFADMQVLLVGA